MGRSAIISQKSCTIKQIVTKQFVSYVIPRYECHGVFHSVENGATGSVIKFFPQTSDKVEFKIIAGGIVSFD